MLLNHKIITIEHSSMVAKAAYIIAVQTKGAIDPDKAHMAGTIHDLGKLYLEAHDSKHMHPIIGYELLLHNDNIEMAEICISHPFPAFDFYEYIIDYCNNDEILANKISEILKTIKITPLIKLIQFTDKISGLNSYMKIEDKFKWYIEKYNITPKSIEQNYLKLIEIKKELDTLASCDIYKLFGIQ